LQKREADAPVAKQSWIPLALTPFASTTTFAAVVTDRPDNYCFRVMGTVIGLCGRFM
jgi:hypothetical protein